jgi:hypothetical protein
MSFERGRYCIHTGVDGRLAGTTEADAAGVFARMATSDKVVVHLHGGLVSSESGFGVAERLTPVYQEAGAEPLFFVWSSGLVEVVTGNLPEIFGEDIFQRLLSRLTSMALRTLGDPTQESVAGAADLKSVQLELARRDMGEEPFSGFTHGAVPADLPPDDEAAFAAELGADDELGRQVDTVLAARLPQGGLESVGGDGGAPVRRRASAQSLMSPEVVDELGRARAEEGVVSAAAVVRKALQVLRAVVRRYHADNDHGLYCTVVEELLRAFYLANAGDVVWHAMKRETEQTFQESAEPRGGKLFMDWLEQAAATNPQLQLTLVGHSTGAVFIDNLLADLASRKSHGRLPAGFRVRNVALLAPAATFSHAAGTVRRWDDVADRFRMFTMSDEAEAADRLVARVYPRSLLYFVSGVVERDAAGRSACVPVVGLQRYYDKAWAEREDDIRSLVDFVRPETRQGRVVWSPTADGEQEGFRSGALSHGSFDDDPLVRASLQQMIRT